MKNSRYNEHDVTCTNSISKFTKKMINFERTDYLISFREKYIATIFLKTQEIFT